jgi:hypothetical protein
MFAQIASKERADPADEINFTMKNLFLFSDDFERSVRSNGS